MTDSTEDADPRKIDIACDLINCESVLQMILDTALSSTAIPNSVLLATARLLLCLDAAGNSSREMNRRLSCLAQYLWVAAFESVAFSQADAMLVRFLVCRLQKGKIKLAAIPDDYQIALRECVYTVQIDQLYAHWRLQSDCQAQWTSCHSCLRFRTAILRSTPDCHRILEQEVGATR